MPNIAADSKKGGSDKGVHISEVDGKVIAEYHRDKKTAKGTEYEQWKKIFDNHEDMTEYNEAFFK